MRPEIAVNVSKMVCHRALHFSHFVENILFSCFGICTLKFLCIFQVNEAFAPQFLAVQKELELDMDKTNVNGGAIALGHPVGTSGARITGHLVHELRRRGAKYAVGSACIGGGQGIAIVLENVQ